MSEQRAILVCVRIAQMRGPPAPGSVRRECEGCRTHVWASQASLRQAEGAADARGVLLLCDQCLPKADHYEYAKPSAGVVEELKKEGVANADAAVRHAFEEITGKAPREDA